MSEEDVQFIQSCKREKEERQVIALSDIDRRNSPHSTPVSFRSTEPSSKKMRSS